MNVVVERSTSKEPLALVVRFRPSLGISCVFVLFRPDSPLPPDLIEHHHVFASRSHTSPLLLLKYFTLRFYSHLRWDESTSRHRQLQNFLEYHFHFNGYFPYQTLDLL